MNWFNINYKQTRPNKWVKIVISLEIQYLQFQNNTPRIYGNNQFNPRAIIIFSFLFRCEEEFLPFLIPFMCYEI